MRLPFKPCTIVPTAASKRGSRIPSAATSADAGEQVTIIVLSKPKCWAASRCPALLSGLLLGEEQAARPLWSANSTAACELPPASACGKHGREREPCAREPSPARNWRVLCLMSALTGGRMLHDVARCAVVQLRRSTLRGMVWESPSLSDGARSCVDLACVKSESSRRKATINNAASKRRQQH